MMLSLNIILVLLVLGLAFFLFFKLLKGVLKAIIAVCFLILFVSGILGVIVYFDVVKIKNSWDEKQIFLLSHNGSIEAGFSYDNSGEKVLQSSNLAMLSTEELNDIGSQLSSSDYKTSGGLTLIIDSSQFRNTSLELAEGMTIQMDEEMLNSVFSCQKLSVCVGSVVDAAPAVRKQIEASFDDEQDLKNKVFFNLFAQESQKSKGAFIVEGIREETITIYPQLTTVRLIRMIPEKIVNTAIEKSMTLATESLSVSEN